ncbi:MAG: hypothetical protein F2589_04655 [Actinobacteria bacterium]|uniref:Unannotated protein n=1 Tax=freshwater metagenome TaxID=449393 RepID=A0A6J6I6C9_9ZZZZ|nr:hypothetical protein [Actinomycetota bacterium]
MSLLNLNAPQGRAPRSKNAAKAWLGVGLLAAVVGIGSTFAANITLNGGNSTESGQGVQSVIYCGGTSQTVTATPFSSYKNTATNAKFSVSGIKITGIPKACDDTQFIVTAYPAGNDGSPTSALTLSNTMASATVLWLDQNSSGLKYPKASSPTSLSSSCDTNPNPTTSSGVVSTGALLSTSRTSYVSGCTFGYISSITADSGSSSSGNGSFTITFNPNNTLADATSLSKITVETQNDVIGTNLKPCTGGPSTYVCSAGTLGLAS